MYVRHAAPKNGKSLTCVPGSFLCCGLIDLDDDVARRCVDLGVLIICAISVSIRGDKKLPGRVWRSHWTLLTRGTVTAAAGGTRRTPIRGQAHAVLSMLKSARRAVVFSDPPSAEMEFSK
jgi:hypothetical protein